MILFFKFTLLNDNLISLMSAFCEVHVSNNETLGKEISSASGKNSFKFY